MLALAKHKAEDEEEEEDDNKERTANSPRMTIQSSPALRSVSLDSVSYNILVVGQAGVGKTGLLKLLIETSMLSKQTTTTRSLARLAEFANYGATCPTTSVSITCLNLPFTDQRPNLVLNLVDTPGLHFHDPHELERGVNLALSQITDAFSSSLAAPAHNQERADKQIHLCLYLLDPADIVPSSTRHLRKPDRYGVPTKLTRQRVHLAAVRNNVTVRPAGLSASSVGPQLEETTQHYDDGDEWGRATVPKAELRVMKRLAEYVTVLPVISKADTLTDERLNVVKSAVRRDVLEAGLDFGPFVAGGEEEDRSLPFAILLPDAYHHGDGVVRTGTGARPTHQEYMTRFESALVDEDTSLVGDGPRTIEVGQLIRSYRWGQIDLADRAHSDIWELREAILGSNIQTLRTRTLEVYFEAYKRDSATMPTLPSSFQWNTPPEPSSSHQRPPPLVDPLGASSSNTSSSFPSLPPTSLFPFQSNIRSSHHPHQITTPSSEFSLPPLEIPTATGSGEVPHRPSPLAPISTVLNPPLLKHSRSAPVLVTPEDEQPHSPTGPLSGQQQQARPRSGRKIAVACNFCRSRKLKCDGGRPQCMQCMRRQVDCEYEPAAKRRGLGKSSQVAAIAVVASRSGGDGGHRTSGSMEESVLPPKTVACQFCRARKTRCDGLQPRCSNCEKRNQECVYLTQPTLEEEIASMAQTTTTSRPRTAPESPRPRQGTWTPAQLTAPAPSLSGTGADSGQGSSYRLTDPLGSHSRPLSISLQSPLTRTKTVPPLPTPPLPLPSRHREESFARFVPPPTPAGSFSSESRRVESGTGGGGGEGGITWRDRGSISSSSTRGGFTPGSPILKRKASYMEEEEGYNEEHEASPSPPKRRRISADEGGYTYGSGEGSSILGGGPSGPPQK